jgi:hypothetical protein
MTPAILRTRLLNLLSSELGRYKNNQPSIWIYGSNSNPPSISDGLEVLIKEVPYGSARVTSSNGRFKPQCWEVYLKNYVQSKKLLQAINKIESNFQLQGNYVHMASTADSIEQCRLLIFDPIMT